MQPVCECGISLRGNTVLHLSQSRHGNVHVSISQDMVSDLLLQSFEQPTDDSAVLAVSLPEEPAEEPKTDMPTSSAETTALADAGSGVSQTFEEARATSPPPLTTINPDEIKQLILRAQEVLLDKWSEHAHELSLRNADRLLKELEQERDQGTPKRQGQSPEKASKKKKKKRAKKLQPKIGDSEESCDTLSLASSTADDCTAIAAMPILACDETKLRFTSSSPISIDQRSRTAHDSSVDSCIGSSRSVSPAPSHLDSKSCPSTQGFHQRSHSWPSKDVGAELLAKCQCGHHAILCRVCSYLATTAPHFAKADSTAYCRVEKSRDDIALPNSPPAPVVKEQEDVLMPADEWKTAMSRSRRQVRSVKTSLEERRKPVEQRKPPRKTTWSGGPSKDTVVRRQNPNASPPSSCMTTRASYSAVTQGKITAAQSQTLLQGDKLQEKQDVQLPVDKAPKPTVSVKPQPSNGRLIQSAQSGNTPRITRTLPTAICRPQPVAHQRSPPVASKRGQPCCQSTVSQECLPKSTEASVQTDAVNTTLPRQQLQNVHLAVDGHPPEPFKVSPPMEHIHADDSLRVSTAAVMSSPNSRGLLGPLPPHHSPNNTPPAPPVRPVFAPQHYPPPMQSSSLPRLPPPTIQPPPTYFSSALYPQAAPTPLRGAPYEPAHSHPNITFCAPIPQMSPSQPTVRVELLPNTRTMPNILPRANIVCSPACMYEIRCCVAEHLRLSTPPCPAVVKAALDDVVRQSSNIQAALFRAHVTPYEWTASVASAIASHNDGQLWLELVNNVWMACLNTN